MSYPTDAELTAYLTEQGLTPLSSLTGTMAGVISEFENSVGYFPFFNSSNTAVTRRYTPEAYCDVMSLQGAYLTITEVKVDLTPQNTVGRVLLSTEYTLEPFNKLPNGQGYSEIRFYTELYANPNGVSVTGVPGYCSTLPADVKSALLSKASATVWSSLVSGLAGLKEEQVGPLKVVYDNESGRGKYDKWLEEYHTTILRYARQ